MTPLPKVGVHSEWMSNHKYHSGPGASTSDLKLLLSKSPAHLKEKKDNPKDPTDAMAVGQAFHTLTLEPQYFDKRFAILPKTENLKTKDGREERDKLIATGKIFLREEKLDDVLEMVKSVQNHPLASDLLLNIPGTTFERPVYWKDPETGLLCKCRPDIMIFNKQLRVIVDLKKAVDADKKSFMRAIGNYGYDVQAAMYLDGCRAATGKDYQAFIFIVCEDYPPYATAVYMADAEMIERGRERYEYGLSIFKKCLRENKWPGYSDDLENIELPAWML